MQLKWFVISENEYLLVFLKQTDSGNLEHMCDFHLDPLVLKHRLWKLKNTELCDEK